MNIKETIILIWVVATIGFVAGDMVWIAFMELDLHGIVRLLLYFSLIFLWLSAIFDKEDKK